MLRSNEPEPQSGSGSFDLNIDIPLSSWEFPWYFTRETPG